ncbi:MAG: hypothetical protein WKG06_09375 [Segetibacter sp.]
MLLQLNRDYGTTIFISSHLLSEIEKMVTDLGIIHKGNLIFQGRIEELLQQHQTELSLIIQTSDNKKAAAILQKNCSANLDAKGMLKVKIESAGETDMINKTLIKNEINVLQLQL